MIMAITVFEVLKQGAALSNVSDRACFIFYDVQRAFPRRDEPSFAGSAAQSASMRLTGRDFQNRRRFFVCTTS